MAQTVRTMSVLAIAGVVAGLAGGALAQVTPGSQQGLGLTGANIPDLLKTVQADPYHAPAEPACQSIPQEILALDQVLGPDVDGEQAKSSKVHMAMNYARGMIPYRGYVRFLTRADSKDKALQRAVTAGIARRAFLRGLEAHLQCAPAADTQVADISDKVADVAVARTESGNVGVAKVEVAETRPAFKPLPATPAGDEIARQMLTPVRTAPVAAPAQASRHVVYRLIDTVSGRPIVPDEPTGDGSGR
jgi:hypothetical protein